MKLLSGIEAILKDPKGNKIDEGKLGEIFLKGPQLSTYIEDESLSDNMFATGDVGFMDKKGLLTIIGKVQECLVIDKCYDLTSAKYNDLK